MGYGWRVNRHARQARNELRKQTKLMQEAARRTAYAQPGPTAAAAGWYADPSGGSSVLRWWDGRQWTAHTRSNAPV